MQQKTVSQRVIFLASEDDRKEYIDPAKLLKGLDERQLTSQSGRVNVLAIQSSEAGVHGCQSPCRAEHDPQPISCRS
jgi:hypothetical protein